MMVCHCTQISDHDIHAAIDWMRASDPQTIITPGKIYRALGKKADCGGWITRFLGTTGAHAKGGVAAKLENTKKDTTAGEENERGRQSHRVS
ncbi:bacterioferritin-associated ferredoxin [Phaeobacter sp. HF9A]|uniref:(2Fe-2S)-binding protein n=1 Tax=Phaeobacter sp. HF9A TaxID=2721561 RepID=UPI00142FD504|nr:(2Fe-2S)-binding protein [Phaeobacter sp. HF9A]NIZ14730.1 (2Fe-2S)-binding protein [Phaeobacter sp. HF9A]